MMILSSILVIIFIFIVALLSCGQAALVAVSNSQVELDVEEGNKKAMRVDKINRKLAKYLNSIQSNIAIFIFAIGGITYSHISRPIMIALDEPGFLIHALLVFAIGLVLLLIVVVFGRMIPKRIANKHPQEVAYFVAGFVIFLSRLMSPFEWLFSKTSVLFGHLFGLSEKDGERLMTEEEIRNIVEESLKSGEIEASESQMIQNVFDFSDTLVEEIMTHRTEIAALNIDATKQEVLKYMQEEHFTRYPVYEKDVDHIIGTVHAKDMLKYADGESDFSLKEILRDPIFIPDSKITSELFKEMQVLKNHIAIVLDEYGGTAGLVTIEDLVEEIVGNIFDEYDDEEFDVQEIEDHVYIVNGLANIDDVEDEIDINLPVDDFDTISGFILGQLGRFPEDNEDINFKYNKHQFIVLEIEENVIKKVKIIKHTEEGEED